MKKGFLIIDIDRNTAIIPMDDPNIHTIFRLDRFISSIKKHKNLSELDKDIRKYLKTGYLEGDNNED